MKTNFSKIIMIFFSVFLSTQSPARENKGVSNSPPKGSGTNNTIAAGCNPTTAKTDLDINNVRATIMVGGDMWWDLNQNPRYEIPKGSSKHSLYAGALWIGGLDAGGNLKAAVMTYRQGGNDFWSGPINQATIDVNPATCFKYDKHWKITRDQVEQFVNGGLNSIPDVIKTWPGNGDPGNNEGQFLAPFFDANGDGIYDPNTGDYPYYDFEGNVSCKSCGDPAYRDVLFGDQTMWWVFNDVGNIHKESEAPSIGLEIQAQAFSFRTNDEINNMTFYKYKIINRSTIALNQTYFGQWVDADLGKFDDDYVGCDVSRGFGYMYNGDADDDGASGYGLNPPAVGVDFFQGPLADPGDGIDNNRNGIIDEPCEEIVMSKFVYYDNENGAVNGNPDNATHYYNYLKGLWTDNSPMTYGGNGLNSGIPCDFMFPGDSDPIGWGVGGTPSSPNPQPDWTEASAGTRPNDRRFLQSAGPFTLQPGAVNYITTGIVWARATSGGPLASVELIRAASDKAQALFDNCFKVLEGPKTPTLAIRELNKELIISITNTQETESFNVIDPAISTTYHDSLRRYKFQGYQIFQLKDATVSTDEVAARNPDRVRLVAQADLRDGISKLVNFTYDQTVGANIPQEMVNGENKGIRHTFKVTKDLFALGDNALINHKQYYFTLVAYAHNNYKTYNQNDPNSLDGQKRPYLPGRKSTTYSGIPHMQNPANSGQVLNSHWGSGPQIRRIEGQGNMDQVLDLTQEAVNEIMSGYPHKSAKPLYEAGRGPINVRVYDPVVVPSADFEVKFDGVADNSKWTLKNLSTGEVRTADTTLSLSNEQLFSKWGLAIRLGKVSEAGKPGAENNGFLEATRSYADAGKPWLSAIADQDGMTIENWVRSGVSGQTPTDYPGVDDDQVYEKILGGTWAPYRLLSKDKSGPKWPQSADPLSPLDKIPSVDVVFTSDRSKWTRSAVIEMCEDQFLAQGSARRFELRKGLSVDRNGVNDGSGTGMGWFPGYAINVSTGERLNIIFGENSGLVSENGRDMIWNPTSNRRGALGDTLLGGMHFVYIMNTLYDSCAYFKTQLELATTSAKRNVYKEAMWVTLPIKAAAHNLLATDVKIRLRVADNYEKYKTSVNPVNADNPLYNFNMSGLAASTHNLEVAKTALDEIRVVPNPYYAYSTYENTQIDNRVKITNLPGKCVVSIYSVNGTLVRQFNRSVAYDHSEGTDINSSINSDLSLDWDLKNSSGIAVSGGVYLIHVKVDGVGERVIKWFGVMRPVDLDTF